MLLRMVFSTKRELGVSGGFRYVFCRVGGLGYAVGFIGFRCHMMCYAPWSGWKCSGAGACCVWLP
jgi:hypothetical protein